MEGHDHGWQAQAGALRATLVPPGLDPDPLTTIEQQAAQQKKRDREAR